MSSSYVVKDILREITQELSRWDIPRASREAQLLLMHHLSKDELWLITNQNTEIFDIDKLLKLVQRRAKNEPLEYITNNVSFYSEDFYIAQGALIPRPETEILIDEVIARVDDRNTTATFVEVGIGSGIISIILARYFINANFIAVDISQDALDIATINRDKFGLNDRIELRLGSLLEPVSEKIDYLVSNPPYIENGVVLESNLDYEPQNALFGGNVGDEIIKELLDQVFKREIRFFSCEIGYDQKEKLSAYLQHKKYKSLDFYKDLSAFDRGFSLEL